MEINDIGSIGNTNNYIQTTTKVYTPKADLSTHNDKIELQNKKKSKSKKALIAACIITAGLVAATVFYKVKQHKISITTPKELKSLFKQLKHKKGEDFINSSYNGIKGHLELNGIAPDKVNLTNNPDGLFNAITGGYDPIKNTIEYSKGFKDKLTKRQQFNLLSHELKHVKQYSTALRTEGIGLKGLVDAEVEKRMAAMKVIPLGNATKDQIAEYLKKKKESFVEAITEDIKQNHQVSLNAPKISAQSAEGIQAGKYIDAIKSYKGLIFGLGGKDYHQNLLEKEAYAFGDKMEDMYGASQGFFSQIKDILRVIKHRK